MVESAYYTADVFIPLVDNDFVILERCLRKTQEVDTADACSENADANFASLAVEVISDFGVWAAAWVLEAWMCVCGQVGRC